MATTADDSQNAGGVRALRRLKSTDAPLYLSASPDLSEAARLASKYLYSSLKPYTPKSPFAQLLTDGFDAEQIWQQIDLQSEPLLSSLRRQIRQFEKKPEEISKLFNLVEEKKREKEELAVEEGESDDFKDVAMEDFDDEDDVDDDDEEEEEDDDDEEGDDGEKSEDGEEENGGVKGGLEDKFFKVNQLEEYMEADEAREYGLKKKTKRTRRKDEEEEDEEDEGEEDEDEDELGFMGLDDDEDDENGGTESARYEDFFGSKKGTGRKKNVKSSDLSDGLGIDDDMSDDNDDNQKKQSLSTHEKELVKLRSTIEEMEKANLEEKAWTMQGEVTAARRPKNSALEVDLDFEHNVRPAPVITEEVTATLEELIQKRIVEGRFDDVQKPPSLPSRAPRETKELDDNKSKKGLAEIYEEEYVQKTGLVSTALSFSDEQKKEATMLFKKLCLKLDALSHFHFTPKPVIEDMSVQANVPALAMEEIAPVAVSDAAMLAPEEVFSGKGDVKEETELTQAERKRRRAKKKRKFKAESSKRMVKVAPQNTLSDDVERNEKS